MSPNDKWSLIVVGLFMLLGASLIAFAVWFEHVEAMRALEIEELQIRSRQ